MPTDKLPVGALRAAKAAASKLSFRDSWGRDADHDWAIETLAEIIARESGLGELVERLQEAADWLDTAGDTGDVELVDFYVNTAPDLIDRLRSALARVRD